MIHLNVTPKLRISLKFITEMEKPFSKCCVTVKLLLHLLMAVGRVKLLLHKLGTDPHTCRGRPSYFWKEMGHKVAYKWCHSLYLFLVVLGLHGCMRAFSSCREWGATLPFCGVLASHCGGFSCCRAQVLGAWASVVATHRLRNCGLQALKCSGFSSDAWAQLLYGIPSWTRNRTCVSCPGS